MMFHFSMKKVGMVMEKIDRIQDTPIIYRNLSYEKIEERESKEGELVFTEKGVAAVDTGIFTGRSPKDKFFVEEEGSKKNLFWNDVNRSCRQEVFDFLLEKVAKHLSGKPLYVFDGYAGSRPSSRLSLRVVSEKAWQHHFCTNMFIRPKIEALEGFEPEFTIYNAFPSRGIR